MEVKHTQPPGLCVCAIVVYKCCCNISETQTHHSRNKKLSALRSVSKLSASLGSGSVHTSNLIQKNTFLTFILRWLSIWPLSVCVSVCVLHISFLLLLIILLLCKTVNDIVDVKCIILAIDYEYFVPSCPSSLSDDRPSLSLVLPEVSFCSKGVFPFQCRQVLNGCWLSLFCCCCDLAMYKSSWTECILNVGCFVWRQIDFG